MIKNIFQTSKQLALVGVALLCIMLATDFFSVHFTSSKRLSFGGYSFFPYKYSIGIALFLFVLGIMFGARHIREAPSFLFILPILCQAVVSAWLIYLCTIVFHIFIGGDL